ncbi:MAG: phenylalanine--tRNA ligase subunit beta [Candidatus Nanoarchaeia archaeon]|nr:phenylalanine--tRNA ligase subunit beta [Candidatus Nanoarchaeia archaeon]
MPTFEASFKDFQKLVGVKLPRNKEKLWKKLVLVKSEVEELDLKNDIIKFEPADSNRPDMWHVEGLARALKGAMGIELGIPKYEIIASKDEILVDKNVKKIRPFIACAVIKGITFTDFLIKQLMQLQLKVDGSYGRKRAKSSIGIYNYEMIKFPVKYKAVGREEVKFVPLGFLEEMTPQQIFELHPKGIEFGRILEKNNKVPLLIDSDKKILSLPPIINSNDVGKITSDTKSVLVEVTGTNKETVLGSLSIVVSALADRGGKVYNLKIKEGKKKIITPNIEPKTITISKKSIEKRIGMKWSDNELKELLLRARFDISKITTDEIIVKIPFYRLDIMHEFDVIEDLAVMYGFENIPSQPLNISTQGGLTDSSIYINKIRDLVVGMEYQEVMNYYRFDKEALFNSNCIEIENPMSSSMNILRNELMPVLLKWMSKNTHNSYPQKIFEVGKVFIKNKDEVLENNHLSLICSHLSADFTEIKQVAQWILKSLGIKYELKAKDYYQYIPGRSASIIVNEKEIGHFGELHPKIILENNMENPIIGLEIKI